MKGPEFVVRRNGGIVSVKTDTKAPRRPLSDLDLVIVCGEDETPELPSELTWEALEIPYEDED